MIKDSIHFLKLSGMLTDYLMILGIAGPNLAMAYDNAFQVSLKHGDVARAQVLAERAYDVSRICVGADHGWTIKLKTCMEQPEEDRCYTPDGDRKSMVSDIPRNLDSVAFEDWLWMIRDE